MQVFASRRESDQAWFLHACTGHADAVAAFLSDSEATWSRHEMAGFVPKEA